MLKNTFIKNVLTLMKGTSIAQLIPIIISPLLTRLYTPKQFGVFAIYIAVISVLSQIVNGRYELAIALPDENKKSLSLFVLTLLINIFVTVGVAIILFLGANILVEKFMLEEINWIYFLPIGVFLVGIYNSLIYLNNRWQRFNHLAKAKINQSVSLAVTQLFFGFFKFGYLGLIIGYSIGQLTSILNLGKSTKIAQQVKEEKIQKTDIKNVAEEYKDFPKYAMITHSTEALATNIPAMLLSKFFGVQNTGYYSLTTRTISMPLSLIGNAVGDVYLSTASKQYREHGECEDLFKKTLKILTLIPIIPFLILFLFAEDIYGFVFGQDWAISGTYTKILIPALYLQFISNPLAHMFIIAKKVKLEFFIQIGILILSVLSFIIGYYYFDSPTASLILFSGVLMLKYFLFIYYSYRFSKSKNEGESCVEATFPSD